MFKINEKDFKKFVKKMTIIHKLCQSDIKALRPYHKVMLKRYENVSKAEMETELNLIEYLKFKIK